MSKLNLTSRHIQSETDHPFGNVPIDKVGIVRIQKRVDIGKKYIFTPLISALIRLPGTQRGIHMSRTAETIEEVVNEAVIMPANSVEEVCHRIAKSLLEYHEYTDYCEVKMRGDIIVPIQEGESKSAQRTYKIQSKVIGHRPIGGIAHYRVFVGTSAEGMTACPCAQEMNREYTEEIVKNRKELNISPDQLEKIFNIFPMASHNQRAIGTITIEVGDEEKNFIDIIDIIKVIEDSMSAKIRDILKRPDEAELVRVAHLNPRFVEDVVRTMGRRLSLDAVFAKIPDDNTVRCQVTSFESIHTYNAYAELKTTFGEIRKIFREETSPK